MEEFKTVSCTHKLYHCPEGGVHLLMENRLTKLANGPAQQRRMPLIVHFLLCCYMKRKYFLVRRSVDYLCMISGNKHCWEGSYPQTPRKTTKVVNSTTAKSRMCFWFWGELSLFKETDLFSPHITVHTPTDTWTQATHPTEIHTLIQHMPAPSTEIPQSHLGDYHRNAERWWRDVGRNRPIASLCGATRLQGLIQSAFIIRGWRWAAGRHSD